ncbi:MAG: hypothetical protein KBD12_00820 [Candidatus Pacebacteria bacterium]|nr:hypothetical protein [Candidatus Paceibacterota bacterium]
MRKLSLLAVLLFLSLAFTSCGNKINIKCFLIKENKFVTFKNSTIIKKRGDTIYLENINMSEYILRKDSFGILAIVDTIFTLNRYSIGY